MKLVYPVIMTQSKNNILVYVPAFDCNTSGKDMAEAIEMARDVISLMAIDYEDDGKKLPEPEFNIKSKAGELISLIDVDLSAYRRKYDNRAVRKNCTIPAWLNTEAVAAGINFSAVLQEALQEKLFNN